MDLTIDTRIYMFVEKGFNDTPKELLYIHLVASHLLKQHMS